MKIVRTILMISLCFLLMLQSCKKAENNLIEPALKIKGLAILEGSSSSIQYSPKGNFIHVKLPDSGLWQYIVLKKANQFIDFKLFFSDEDEKRSLLYDNLSFGEYQIEYISQLRDTIVDKLEFNKSIELDFPQKLNEFYNNISLKELKNISLKKNDTLQLLYRHNGCFGASETLVEFLFKDIDEISLRKKNVLGSTLMTNKDWVYIENTSIKESLNQFILKSKTLVYSNLDLCTSDINYTFRKKHTNTIAVINDKSCELIEEIERVLNPRKPN
ncbi:hypothetical protein [Winogradskyella sp. Asnod2-B02-A]|uniref:hypothetical protein n=1 Tax=Winogradskyella sp. Asnod2-B02-A TaxID=3160583 RepID=UPI00386F3B59